MASPDRSGPRSRGIGHHSPDLELCGLNPDIEPMDVLDEAHGTLRMQADEAEPAYRNGEDITAALAPSSDPTWTVSQGCIGRISRS